MGLQSYYDNYASQPSRWSHADAARCGCRGLGWWNSELDTWHACPAHNYAVDGCKPPHPEGEGHEGFNYVTHKYLNTKLAYAYYRDGALAAAKAMGEEMTPERFRNLAQAELAGGFSGDHSAVTPRDWVEAARAVSDVYAADAERIASEEADRAAQASGYSCALEARWAADAAAERF